MNNLYRLPAPLVILQHVGFHKQCPQCGAEPVKCTKCRHTTTAVTLPDNYRKPHCGHWTPTGRDSPSKYVIDGYYENPDPKDPVAFLTFTRRTNEDRLCSPQRRVRYGFLWLCKCREPGVHVHQRCERCRWQGIAAPEGA